MRDSKVECTQRELSKIWPKSAMTIARLSPENNIENFLETTQLFCRLMLQASLIAMPLYLGLFIISIPFDSNVGFTKGLILTTPVLEFIVAAVMYSVGFLTPIPDGDREIPEGLKRRIIHRKVMLILSGSAFFLIGVGSGTLLLFKSHL